MAPSTTGRCASLIAALCAAPASAAVPAVVTYSGALTTGGGEPADGDYTLMFRLCDAVEAGACPFEETHDVTVEDGRFAVDLGDRDRDDFLAALAGVELWLEVQVAGEAEPFSPRQPLRSVPFALRAGASEALGAAALGEDGASPVAARSDHAHRGAYLPLGDSLLCADDEKVVAIDAASGDLRCLPDLDTPVAPGTYLPVGTVSQCAPGERVVGVNTATGDLDCLPEQGDIASVTAGVGLAGGGDAGDVTLSVDFTAVAAAGHAHDGEVPPGMIAFFAGPCPAGWRLYESLGGRFLVGLAGAGTVEGASGVAMEDLGTAGAHGHRYADVVSHAHVVDPPAVETGSGGLHGHRVTAIDNVGPSVPNPIDRYLLGNAQSTQIATSVDGAHTHALDPPPFVSDVATDSVADGATDPSAATPPYLQLVACRRAGVERLGDTGERAWNGAAPSAGDALPAGGWRASGTAGEVLEYSSAFAYAGALSLRTFGEPGAGAHVLFGAAPAGTALSVEVWHLAIDSQARDALRLATRDGSRTLEVRLGDGGFEAVTWGGGANPIAGAPAWRANRWFRLRIDVGDSTVTFTVDDGTSAGTFTADAGFAGDYARADCAVDRSGGGAHDAFWDDLAVTIER